MAPGTYLEKRRLMAGYSLSSLARELLMLTGFGSSRAESDFRRLRLTLASAEAGSLHHRRDRIELIRAFIPLDVSLYLHLVECERSGDPYRVDGICAVCACSFLDPCVLHVGPTATLGASACHWTDPRLCSACDEATAGLTPRREPGSAEAALEDGALTIAQQLRDIGERMRRIAFREDVRAAVAGGDHPASNLGHPPFLRVVPNTGEHHG